MDQHSLRLLANGGFAAVPASQLPTLSEWCWDFGVASADARYFVLSRVFEVANEAFGDAGQLAPDVYEALGGALSRSLSAIIDEEDLRTATSLASRLLEDVLSVLHT